MNFQQKIQLDLAIPHQHPAYKDHFPDDPVVPGALLIQWVSKLMIESNLLDNAGKIESFKFLRKVRPGDTGELIIEKNNQKGKGIKSIKVTCIIAESPAFKGVFQPLSGS